MITAQQWQQACSALNAAHSPLIVAHLAPDADALGSALALGLAMAARGCAVTVSVGEPGFTVPAALRDLPGQHLITPPPRSGDGFDCLIAMDSTSVARLGSLGGLLDTVHPSVAIDHHRSHVPYADVTLVDPTAAATASLVAETLTRCGLPLTAAAATCLYAGLLTDTGSFRLPTVNAGVHRGAALLLDAGADPTVAAALFDNVSVPAQRLLGRALTRMTVDTAAINGLGIAAVVLDRGDFLDCAAGPEQAEAIIGVLRQTAGVDVAVLLRPVAPSSPTHPRPSGDGASGDGASGDGASEDGASEDGASGDSGAATWTVSLRSRGGVDVAAVATALGGGGHRAAAGAQVTGPAHAGGAAILASISRLCTDNRLGTVVGAAPAPHGRGR